MGIHGGFEPRALDRLIARVGIRLLLVWIAFATLSFAWFRSLRSRDLGAALEREHRERARLEELNLAAAGLAHETKNPLGLIRGIAQRLAASSAPETDARAAADDIVDESDRAAARLDDFLNFARTKTPQEAAVSGAAVIESVARTLQADFDAASVHLERRLEEGQLICDVDMLEQVLVNLLLNSLQACLTADRDDAKTTIELAATGDRATLTLTDDGCGIPANLLADIFKPYVTGRPDGHGLGLSMVKRIAELHGWTVSAANRPGGGATVSIAGIKFQPESESQT